MDWLINIYVSFCPWFDPIIIKVDYWVSHTPAPDCHAGVTITRWFIPSKNQTLSVSM
jgi:hypothetical protein